MQTFPKATTLNRMVEDVVMTARTIHCALGADKQAPERWPLALEKRELGKSFPCSIQRYPAQLSAQCEQLFPSIEGETLARLLCGFLSPQPRWQLWPRHK